MSAKTRKQLKNIREALVWWQTVPEENVYPYLNNWTSMYDLKGRDVSNRQATTCNTIACFGGWACRHPSLIAQGAIINEYGWPEMKRGRYVEEYGVAKRLFGDSELFKWRGQHEADKGFEGTDHALVTNRLRWALEH